LNLFCSSTSPASAPNRAFAAGLIALVLLAVGCGSSGEGSPGHGRAVIDTSGVITIGTTQEPTGFNPATTVDGGATNPFLQDVYDSLVQQSTTTGDVEPDLATSWRWSSNHLILNMTLRQGVKFQDGTPFNAAAVAWFENYYLSQGDDGAYLTDVTHVDATGPYTVAFDLSSPNSILLGSLTHLPGYIPSPAAFKKEGSAGLATHPVGTGPYEFVSEQAGYDVILKSWSGYWNNAHEPRASGLDWQFFSTDTAEVDAIKSGAIDAATSLLPQDYAALKHYPGLVATAAPGVDNWFGLWNEADPPFNSADFRLALQYAVNGQGLNEVVLDGAGSAPESYATTVPAEQGLLPLWTYDPALARQYLRKAGYPNGVKLTCYAEAPQSGGDYSIISPVLLADYSAVGIHMTLKPLLSAQLGAALSGSLTPCLFYNVDAANTSDFGIEQDYQNFAYRGGLLNIGHLPLSTDTYVTAFRNTFTNSGLDQLFYDITSIEKMDPPPLAPILAGPEVNVYKDDIAGYATCGYENDHWYEMYRTS
jgi:ABC-type transport system substrate-binding protein